MLKTLWVAIVIALCVPSTHADSLYFSYANSPDPGLRRATLDGSIVKHFVDGNTVSVAVDHDAGQVYWGQIGGGGPDGLFPTIWRANIDGSDMTILHEPLFVPEPLAVDPKGGWIFSGAFLGEGCGGIQRLSMDGSGSSVTVVNDCPAGIAVDSDAGWLYWTVESTAGIWRANLDGSAKVLISTGGSKPYDLALDAAHEKFYWSEVNTSNLVVRADFDGQNKEVLVFGIQDSRAVALDLGFNKLYFTVNEGSVDSIYRAELNGSNSTKILEQAAIRGQIAIDTPPNPDNVPAVSKYGLIVLLLGALLLSSGWIAWKSSPANTIA